MAELLCDICGGKISMGSGGIAVCDSCGIEYKKERIHEKVQEIKGTVRVDNSHMIDNWMQMGNAAAEAGNHKESYDYFTKVIEVDSENWRAIYEKGKAGAWQSTLCNLRTAEIYQGITTSLDIINRLNLSVDEVIGLKNEFAVALFNFNNAITDLMEQNLTDIFDKYFDSHWNQMWNTRQRYLTNVNQLEDALTLIIDLEDDLSKNNVIEFKKRMCSDLINACASIQYWTNYSESSLGYFGFSIPEKKQYLDKFWSLVDDIRIVETDFATTKYNQPDPFSPGFELNRSDRIFEYWKKRDDVRSARKEREEKKRFSEYWNAHQEEKFTLEAEKASIIDKIAILNDEIVKISGGIEKANIQEKIKKLISDKESLGIFKGKEKKAIQEQIYLLKAEINVINDKLESSAAEIRLRIDPLNNRINEIHNELTKIRKE